MQVLIEPVTGNGFQAGALGLTAHGSTEQEALANLRKVLARRTAAGAKIVPLDSRQIPPPGDLQDDPMFDDWVAAMEEYRRQRDAELDAP